MFGKQEKQNKAAPKAAFNIKTIPDIFYGGADPEIYHEKKIPVAASKSESKPVVKEPVKKETAKAPIQASAQPGMQPPPKPITKTVLPRPMPKPKKRRTGLYILFFLLFIVVIAAISWYYINEARPPVETATPTSPTEEGDLVVVEPEQEQDVVVVEEEEEVPTTTPSLEVEPLTFPRSILTDSVDNDNDSLTDMEEELFGIETEVWDTDGDGYYDGQEIYNLYSPKGFAPTKLVDSGLIREYINPKWKYRLYYPSSWEVGVVDRDSKQVLFSAITGDYVEVRVVEKEVTESFESWFARNATEQQFSDLKDFTNRFQEDCKWREDSLVAYFIKDNLVFVIIYHPGTTGNVPYRHIMEMITQSFRPAATDVEIPEQKILILPPTTTVDEESGTTREENI